MPWIIECGKPGVNPFHIFETVDCDEGVDLIAFAADTSPEPLMIATDAKAVEVSVRRRGISGGELRRTQNGKSAAEVRLVPDGGRKCERRLSSLTGCVEFAAAASKHRLRAEGQTLVRAMSRVNNRLLALVHVNGGQQPIPRPALDLSQMQEDGRAQRFISPLGQGKGALQQLASVGKIVGPLEQRRPKHQRVEAAGRVVNRQRDLVFGQRDGSNKVLWRHTAGMALNDYFEPLRRSQDCGVIASLGDLTQSRAMLNRLRELTPLEENRDEIALDHRLGS